MVKKQNYTVKAFAQAVGVSVQTTYDWKRKGVITPYYTIGGRPYYTQEQVDMVLKVNGQQ